MILNRRGRGEHRDLKAEPETKGMADEKTVGPALCFLKFNPSVASAPSAVK
jgi:hypothetical protein